MVISNITEGELLNEPERVKTLSNDLQIDYEVLELTDESVIEEDGKQFGKSQQMPCNRSCRKT